MNARGKLNIANFNGVLLLAGLAGGICQSWPVFFVSLAGGILASLCLGGIRPSPRNRPR